MHALLWHFEPVWWYAGIAANLSKSGMYGNTFACVNIKRYVSVISDRQTDEARLEDLHVPFSFKHIRWNCKDSTVPETKKEQYYIFVAKCNQFLYFYAEADPAIW